MSDEFKDLDIDDFEASNEDVVDNDYKPEKKKRESSALMGILAGILLTVIFEIWMGLGLDVANNLVHRYTAYMLGILVIFVVAFFTRSILKMVFFAMPIVVGTSFILPFFFPDIFSALMAPFLNLLPIATAMIKNSSSLGLDVSSYQSYITLVETYGIVLDFIIAIFVTFFAGVGLVMLVKVLSNKPNVMTIISLPVGLFFFILGVIILPYFVVILTGVVHFGMAFGVGGLALNEGLALSAAGDVNGSNVYFNEATFWFEQADAMLQGLNDLGAFYFLGLSIPDIRPLIDNGFLVIDAGVSLAKGIGPMMNGITNIQIGIDAAMSALDASGSSALSLSSDIEQFNAGIAQMELGFADFTSSVNYVKEAISTLLQLNDQELIDAAAKNNIQEFINKEQLDLIRGAANLLDVSLDVFLVLINDANKNDDNIGSPFIHLMLGAYALNSASSAIGNSTSFEGTIAAFEAADSNFTVVVDALGAPAFDKFYNSDVGNSTVILDMKNQLTGIFRFIEDSGNIAISVSEFGIVANPVLTGMNETMSVFSTPDPNNPNEKLYDNFTVIPDAVYDEMLVNLTRLYPDAGYMKVTGDIVDYYLAQMVNRTKSDYYGMMTDQASSFAQSFQEFNLTENADNFEYMIGGFIGMINTIKGLRNVDTVFATIGDDLDVINQLDLANYNLTMLDIIQTQLGYVNGNVTLANNMLDDTIPHIDNAIGNFSQIENMPQMNTTAQAFINIKEDIQQLQCTDQGLITQKGLCEIEYLTQEVVFLSNPPTSVNSTLHLLTDDPDGQLVFVDGKFVDINTEIQKVEVAG